jgi:hypothetical protein
VGFGKLAAKMTSVKIGTAGLIRFQAPDAQKFAIAPAMVRIFRSTLRH